MSNFLFYKDLYDKLYDLGYHSSETTSHTVPVLKILINKKIKFENVLDCGSSIGNALLFLKNRGIKGEGLEISEVATNRANKRGLKTTHGSVDNLPFDDNTFDLVVCCDVIEHLKPRDIPNSIDEMVRVSSKYVCIKPCTHAEKNKTPLNKLKAKHPEYNSLKNLHITVRDLSWYTSIIERLGLKVTIDQDLLKQGIIFLEKN